MYPTCLSVFLGTLDGNAASGICGLRHLEISQPDEEKISGAAQVAFCRGRNSKAAHQMGDRVNVERTPLTLF